MRTSSTVRSGAMSQLAEQLRTAEGRKAALKEAKRRIQERKGRAIGQEVPVRSSRWIRSWRSLGVGVAGGGASGSGSRAASALASVSAGPGSRANDGPTGRGLMPAAWGEQVSALSAAAAASGGLTKPGLLCRSPSHGSTLTVSRPPGG